MNNYNYMILQHPRMKDERLKIFFLLLFILIFLTAGCSPFHYEPEQTVIIEISPISGTRDRQEVLAKLRGMFDHTSHTLQIKAYADTLRIAIAPVHNVESFARRIDFGQVTKIQERTITVKYNENKIYI